MFRLYDQNENPCAPIIDYYDVSIEEELNALKTIDFSLREDIEGLVVEGYLETQYGNFVIKEIDKDNEGVIKVHAIQNAEELQGARLLKAELDEQTIQSAFNILFGKSVGADNWTAQFHFPSGNRLTTAKRSNQFYKTSLWEALQDLREQFYAEYQYDEIKKIIHVYDAAERRLYSDDKGVMLMRDLNLANISVQRDSNDFITTIYPYGKEVKGEIRLNISDVKGDGTYYLSNHTYTDKIIREYWVDTNYEPKQISDTIEATKDKQTAYTLTETPKTKSWIISVECKIKSTKNKKTVWNSEEVKSSYYDLSGKKITITNEKLKNKITDGSKLIVKYYINYGSRAEELMADAQIRLNELSTPAVSFTIKAIDLAKISGSSTDFTLGDILTLRDDSDIKMRIVGKKWNPLNPEEVSLTLNSRRKSLDEAQARRKRFVNKIKNNTSNSGSATSTSSKSVSSSSLQPSSVGSDQIINGSIMSLHIGEAAIERANIAEAAIGEAQIEDASITTAKIGTAQITSALIEDAAISTAKIEDAAITKAKIGTAAIGTAQIEIGAIGTAQIADAAITNALIATGAVQTAQIADGSITDAKILELTANKITSGTIDAANIEVINLNAANLTVGTINGTQIASGTIELGNLSKSVIDAMGSGSGIKTYFQAEAPATANEGDLWFDIDDGNKLYSYQNGEWTPYTFGSSALSANCITSEHLTTGAITAGKIAAGAVSASNIVAGAITSDKIAAGAVSADTIASGAITTDKIASKAITASKIATATITANEIAANTITSAEIKSGTITGSKIAANTITSAEIDTTDLFSQSITASNLNITGGKIEMLSSPSYDSTIYLVYSNYFMNLGAGGVCWGNYNSTERIRITPTYGISLEGDLRLQAPKLYITDGGATIGGGLTVSSGGLTVSGGQLDASASRIRCLPTYNNTVSYATNMYVGTTGIFSRSTNTSSRTIKDDIKPLQNIDLKAENLYNAEIVQFKYKEEVLSPEDMRYRIDLPGFIVEDLEEVYPIAVDKDEEGKPFAWNAQYLIPPMLKLIQEQKKEIDEIKAELAQWTQ